MGLFGGLAKLVGKVVKTGLSVATGGKSDAALKIVKSVTGIGKPKAKPAMTNADAVAALQYQPNITTGYGTFAEGAGSAMPGLKRSAPKKKAARKKKAKKASNGYAKLPPKGGLDLKALSKSWNAAGKPGTWQNWIKNNK